MLFFCTCLLVLALTSCIANQRRNEFFLPRGKPPKVAAAASRQGSRSHRSGAGNQPHDAYFNLNITKPDEGTVLLNVHAGAGHKLRFDPTEPDDSEHGVDPKMISHYKDEIAIFGYLMTQYSLKAVMRKFGA